MRGVVGPMANRRPHIEPEEERPYRPLVVGAIPLFYPATIMAAVALVGSRQRAQASGGDQLALGYGEHRFRLSSIEETRLDRERDDGVGADTRVAHGEGLRVIGDHVVRITGLLAPKTS